MSQFRRMYDHGRLLLSPPLSKNIPHQLTDLAMLPSICRCTALPFQMTSDRAEAERTGLALPPDNQILQQFGPQSPDNAM
jgi:hypothetical protein